MWQFRKVAFRIVMCALILETSRAYKTCSDNAYNFKGYTYKLEGNVTVNEKVWSHCEFYNPLYDHILCGWSQNTNENHYLCDPDNLVSSQSTAQNIDLDLYNVQTNTTTLCVDATGNKESYIVGVAIIDRIRIPDMHSSDLCINDCNEMKPDRNTSASYPSEAQQYEIMANFANSLRASWRLGSCGNDVIVLYCKEFNMLYISPGYRAAYYLTDSKISSLTSAFLSYLNTDSSDFQAALERAILDLINDIRTSLRALTPAHKLLIATMVVLLLFVAWFVFYLVVRDLEMNVWGQTQPWKSFEWFLHAVTGVWLVRGLMVVMLMLSNKGLNWALGVSVTMLIGCVAMYFVSVDSISD